MSCKSPDLSYELASSGLRNLHQRERTSRGSQPGRMACVISSSIRVRLPRSFWSAVSPKPTTWKSLATCRRPARNGRIRLCAADRRLRRSAAQEPPADQAAAWLQDQSLRDRSRRAAHGGRAARGRDLRRHAQGRRLGGHRPQQGRHCRRGEAVRTVAGFRHPERRLLLEGRLPLRRRAQSRPHLPGGGVLLREPRRRRWRCRQGRRAHSRRRGVLQPHRPRLRDRPRQKLYIQLGQPFNVPPQDKMEPFKKYGIGGIIRVDQDGTNREVYATGLRNPVGIDFNPANGELWTNDNQVDGMGDDIPPGELNRITKPGQNFGFPWYGGGHVRTDEYKDSEPPADAVSRWSRRSRTRPISAWSSTPAASSRRNTRRASSRPSTAPGTAPFRRRAGPVHADQRRRHGRPAGGFAAGWLTADGEYIGRPVGLPSCMMVRCSSPTTSPERSTVSPTVSDDFGGYRH